MSCVRTEAELLTEARAGNRQAFMVALRPHLAGLFAYSRAICGDFHAAEDVVQETAMAALGQLDRLYPDADFGAWLRGIAKRQAFSNRRRTRRLGPLLEEAIELAYEESEPAEYLEKERKALEHCLRQLGKRAGLIVRRHYRDGTPLGAIAVEVKLSLGAVKMALYRARMRLRECTRHVLDQGVGP